MSCLERCASCSHLFLSGELQLHSQLSGASFQYLDQICADRETNEMIRLGTSIIPALLASYTKHDKGECQ